jgi:hypothetical protein
MKLFLFPHQDDEYFVWPLLKENPKDNICLYLTTGEFYGENCNTRNAESMNVLQSLGVPEENIFFQIQDLKILDTSLQIHITSVYFSILKALPGLVISEIYCPAFEGGHPDHDASAMLAFALGRKFKCPAYQFYLYQGNAYIRGFFNVMKPVPGDGVQIKNVSLGDGLRWAFLFRHYKSQRKTWVGLSLFVLFHFLIKRRIIIRKISSDLFSIRPNNGILYYEYRGWTTFQNFQSDTQSFRDQYINQEL